MEGKAEVFAEEREKRMESFRAERAAAEDRVKAKIEDVRSEVKNQVKETLNTIGVATKDEIDDIKNLIGDLSKKVDDLSK